MPPPGPPFELSSIFFDLPTKPTAVDFWVKKWTPYPSPISRYSAPNRVYRSLFGKFSPTPSLKIRQKSGEGGTGPLPHKGVGGRDVRRPAEFHTSNYYHFRCTRGQSRRCRPFRKKFGNFFRENGKVGVPQIWWVERGYPTLQNIFFKRKVTLPIKHNIRSNIGDLKKFSKNSRGDPG